MNAKPMHLVPSPTVPRKAIKSQADEGWRLDSDDYDDSGLSAASADLLMKGYSAILRSPPDLVLCDISMPSASGFDGLERIAAAPPLG